MFVVESHEDVRKIIRSIVECLDDSDWKVCRIAVNRLSQMAEQRMC